MLRIERLAGGEVRLERADGSRPPADVELAFFRVAQEALANAVKHGRPPILVRYATTPGGATLSIDDAGPGIEADAGEGADRAGHFGLLNMQQRAEAIGAILDIRRWPSWRHARRAGLAGALSQEAAPIRVGIVDDHPVVGEGTAAILRPQPDITVIGVAPSLEAAVAAGLFDGERVDVVLLDIRLGTDSGLRALAPAGDGPSSAVAARPAIDRVDGLRLPAVRRGCAPARCGRVRAQDRATRRTGRCHPARRRGRAGVRGPAEPEPERRLSAREHDVVRLVADGRTNDEIGPALRIGAKTVETHLARLFERLGVASRTELAMRAVREGWLDVPPGGR